MIEELEKNNYCEMENHKIYSEPCNGKIILKTKWKRCYERERRNRKTVRETERVVMLGPRFNGPYLAQL